VRLESSATRVRACASCELIDTRVSVAVVSGRGAPQSFRALAIRGGSANSVCSSPWFFSLFGGQRCKHVVR